jgi:hypothetical protein
VRPGEYHDDALPRRSYEGLFGTILCTRCDFFGLGYLHPETCTWGWLKGTGRVRLHLDLAELGDRVTDALTKSGQALPIYRRADLGSRGETEPARKPAAERRGGEDVLR